MVLVEEVLCDLLLLLSFVFFLFLFLCVCALCLYQIGFCLQMCTFAENLDLT